MNNTSLIRNRLFAADDSSTPLYFITCDVIALGSLDAVPKSCYEVIKDIAEIGDVLL